MSTTDVLVLRQKTHGLPGSEYATELRDRLPDYDVRLASTPQEERELAADARVISSVRFDTDLLDRAANMELFAGIAAGYDHLPLDEMAARGITVTNASGIHAPNIAEQVMAYVLSHTRNLDVARERQERREWRHYQADELKGSTVTVVGVGAIGKVILERVQAFDVKTIGVRYSPEKGGPADEIVGFDEAPFHAALAETDHLVIASPLTETTRGLIDAEAFETLPPNAYLVNVGRGPIVDTDALVAALRSNAISGAALDVTDPEPLPAEHDLWKLGNVTITPHNAGHSPAHYDRLADIVAGNVRRLDDGASPSEFENVVRMPE